MADDGAEVLGFGALFSFEGRANRGTFWKVMLLILGGVGVVAALVIPKLATAGGADAPPDTTTLVLIVAGYALVLWISLATQVKRWHDMDKSGWFALLNLIPAINFFVFLYIGFNPGTEGSNRFGAGPRKILF